MKKIVLCLLMVACGDNEERTCYGDDMSMCHAAELNAMARCQRLIDCPPQLHIDLGVKVDFDTCVADEITIQCRYRECSTQYTHWDELNACTQAFEAHTCDSEAAYCFL